MPTPEQTRKRGYKHQSRSNNEDEIVHAPTKAKPSVRKALLNKPVASTIKPNLRTMSDNDLDAKNRDTGEGV
jgi:hypothetical protein